MKPAMAAVEIGAEAHYVLCKRMLDKLKPVILRIQCRCHIGSEFSCVVAQILSGCCLDDCRRVSKVRRQDAGFLLVSANKECPFTFLKPVALAIVKPPL